jgi:hypothetical protein
MEKRLNFFYDIIVALDHEGFFGYHWMNRSEKLKAR